MTKNDPIVLDIKDLITDLYDEDLAERFIEASIK